MRPSQRFGSGEGDGDGDGRGEVARQIGASRQAGVRTRLDPAVYRRRRLLAGGLFLLMVAAVLVVAQLAVAGTGGGPLSATGAAATPIRASVYVVQPGDTLWSIGRALDPKGDERPLVSELASELHGASLYPGERVSIPALR